VGSGAVGCFYASRLHNLSDGVLVSLICRSNYQAVKEHGVRLRTRSYGDYVFTPENVFKSVEDARNLLWDYIVVATKALPDVSDDSELLSSIVTQDKTTIVLIQNGIGVEQPYRVRFPNTPILSAVTVISAEQTEPGVVVQNRWTRISIGPFTDGNGRDNASLAEPFASLLRKGGIKDAEVYDEQGLQIVRWHKIAINAAMNPSSVLSGGTPNATMVKDPELRSHLTNCIEEVFRGASAVTGISFPPPTLATAEQIIRSTERNEGGRPSMLLDWERGGAMELEVILGNPIRLALEKGVEMPRLHAMYALLKTAQSRRDTKGSKL
ncbi:ketopantoate reductase PanE/ApbA-domain-containing protein, partial [Cantharellus anzutake]|uniref:ketopantoate reductase PanE/ApbA-domain-containing protein n=1 Tax=Cantharellus anzutake TaxID=1750568 RepID=UPI00190692C8